MTFELTTTTKVLALVGLLLAAGLTGTLILEHHRSASPAIVAPATTPNHTHTPPHAHRAPPSRHPAPSLQLTAGLPAPLRSALAHTKLVVAVVYAPGDPVDAEVYAQAQQGAQAAHAPIVALNIRNDTIAATTAAWMNKVVEPAVLIVKRPGTILVELDGYTDGESVAQAVADTRR
jgi:hypothetical protein